MAIINRFSKYKYPLMLAAIFIFHAFMGFKILYNSQIIRVYDDSRLVESLRYYQLMFLDPANLQTKLKHVLSLVGQAHPPLYITVQAFACKVAQVFNKFDENSIVLLTNMPFLFILLASVYGIGSLVYSRKVGIISALFISFFPIIYGYSRNLLLDFPLTCMTALSFYMLFRTDGFRSLRSSILLGIALGLAQLTKESFAAFIFFPGAYYLYKSYRTNPKKRVLINSSLALLCAVAVAGVVYFRPTNIFAIRHYVGKTFFINKQPLDFYFRYSLAYLGTFVLVSSIPVLLSYLKNFRSCDKTIFLWLISPLIIFSLAVNKCPRFIIPVFPALALIIVSELFSVKRPVFFKMIYGYFIISLSVLQHFVYFFGLWSVDPGFYRNNQYLDFPGMVTYRKDKYYSAVSELVKIFREENNKLKMREEKRAYWVLFLPNIGELLCGLEYKAVEERLPFFVDSPQVADAVDAPLPGTVNWQDKVLEEDYIVDKSGYVTVGGGGARENIEEGLVLGFKKHRGDFEQIGDIKTFDGSSIYVYKNIKRLK